MPRKYNTRHQRARSRYPFRLAARGLSKAPRMPDLDVLRKWAEQRARGEDPEDA